jgi:hypothetical protein
MSDTLKKSKKLNPSPSCVNRRGAEWKSGAMPISGAKPMWI